MSLVIRRKSSPNSVVGGQDEGRECLKELWLLAHQTARLTKKQVDVNIAERLALLINMGSRGRSVHMDFVFGSFAMYSTVLKGVCVIYARQMDSLIRDCEMLLFRKFVSKLATGSDADMVVAHIPTASRSILSSSRRRKRSMDPASSRRSSLLSIPPLDLDGICEELGRDIGLDILPRASPTGLRFLNKRSRSGSSVSMEDPGHSTDDFIFDAVPESEEVVFCDLASILNAAQVPSMTTPTRREPPSLRPKQLKGFDAKVGYTTLQWARILRDNESNQIDISTQTALFFAKQGHTEGDDRSIRENITGSPRDDELMSIASAVDDVELDELRADSVVDPFENIGWQGRSTSGRNSLASTVARESIGSSIFGVGRSIASPGNLKELIRVELVQRGRSTHTVLGIADVCTDTKSKRFVAAAFLNILTLASAGDITIEKNGGRVAFANDQLSFTLNGTSASSSDDN